MRILAIDPGSHLGWATNATGRLEWGVEDFRIKNGESSGNRWRRFGAWLDDVTLSGPRIGGPNNAGTALRATPPLSHVDLIVYERSHFMAKARAAAEIAAGFTTRLEEHCERHGIALHPVPVQTLKAFALPAVKRPPRKKGETIEEYRKRAPLMDRSKEAMIRAAQMMLPNDESRFRIAEKATDKVSGMNRDGLLVADRMYELTDDEADALLLYWYAEQELAR